MKKKLILLMSCFLVCSFLVIPSKAQADTNLWASVEINRVWQHEAYLDVWLNEVDGVFSNKRFRVYNDNPKSKEITAIILTALTVDVLLRVNFDDGDIATLKGISFYTK